MILERLLGKLHIRAHFTKLVVGSALAALAIFLWTVSILKLFGFSVNLGIPAALAAIGAATHAARMRK